MRGYFGYRANDRHESLSFNIEKRDWSTTTDSKLDTFQRGNKGNDSRYAREFQSNKGDAMLILGQIIESFDRNTSVNRL